ncbi:UDP-glucose:glycoprotein glucosyltransferases [Striga asiatica]|uniref:UDP-glucose:glycoprotein glucosyltransferases n=1 Tax=Striga asiatica TaxID=4170 RepID=A0A5A7Q2B1_STRAF|nr:UDP-glucose:glycoprotein glucosyltransferases [Striga asiatica]
MSRRVPSRLSRNEVAFAILFWDRTPRMKKGILDENTTILLPSGVGVAKGKNMGCSISGAASSSSLSKIGTSLKKSRKLFWEFFDISLSSKYCSNYMQRRR